jgi:sodium-dependent dicarboxylate transporter 2/3/5
MSTVPTALLPTRDTASERRRLLSLAGALLAGLAAWAVTPVAMKPEAARLCGILAAAIVLWVTEALPVAITSLLAPAACVVLGVGAADKVFAPFGNPLLYLFFGAFVIAIAAERTRLDRWLAGRVFPRERTSPVRSLTIASLVTAGISSVLSNTATTAMMLPIVRAIVERLGARAQALGLLTAAYSSSLGGVLTPIGTPPNLIAIAALRQFGKGDVPFFLWTVVALPMAITLLGVWLAMLRRGVADDSDSAADAADTVPFDAHEPLQWGQRATLFVLMTAAAGWVLPGVLELGLGSKHSTTLAIKAALPEGVVGILAATLLFVLPGARKVVAGHERVRPVLEWHEAVQLDWGTILLFGGGLALGDQVFQSGLSAWLGTAIIQATGVSTELGLTCLCAWTAVLLSELTSNTATAALLCPLAVMTSQQLGISPVAPVIATGLAASMGFLMPISTAPNAIVYGTGRVPLATMAKTGAMIDLCGMIVIPPTVLWVTKLVGLR